MIIDGKKIKEDILNNLKENTKNLSKKPTLAILLVGEDPASIVYVNQKKKMFAYLEFNCIIKEFNSTITESNLIEEINLLNNDDSVNGIIVQLPLPKHINSNNVVNSINNNKDIDGLTDINFLKLIKGEKGFVPCTPKGIIKIFEYYNISPIGKNIVIVGRSSLVGKPLLHLLLNMNATVTMCHSKTNNLSLYTKNADILIVATGHKHLITNDMVKEGSVIIDVGINREKNKLYGDTDYDNIKDKVSYITPVPGGVGPMTIAMLATNLYEAYLQNNNKNT